MEEPISPRPQSSPEAQNAAVRRMNSLEINICGGTAFVPEEQLERDRQERLRLHEQLFGNKAAPSNDEPVGSS